MKRYLLIIVYLFLLSGTAFPQVKQKPPVKQVVSELKKLLIGTKLPYEMENDSLAVIPYSGENISSNEVLVQRVSDLYIIYTNLTKVFPGKVDETKYKYLLHQNDHFDIVKIGMGDDNTVYLRADVYRTGITTIILARIIGLTLPILLAVI